MPLTLLSESEITDILKRNPRSDFFIRFGDGTDELIWTKNEKLEANISSDGYPLIARGNVIQAYNAAIRYYNRNLTHLSGMLTVIAI
ncbi:MAG: hypothetical protein ABW007_03055 [Chitinophagaceae bacterium]